MDTINDIDIITIASNKRHDQGTDHSIFDGTSNIVGNPYKQGQQNRYSQHKLNKNVNRYNKYYSKGDNDVNVNQAHNFALGRAEEAAEWVRVYGAMDGSREGGAPNGRIDGVGVNYIPSFQINQSNEQDIYNNFSSDSVKGNLDSTDFSRNYFSESNVKNLQLRIRMAVYELSDSKFNIDNQSEKALKTVMRSYFLQYKMSNYKDNLSQIKELNGKVIDWCSDNIYSNLLQYKQYLKDINTMPLEMARPLNMSIKGSNTAFDFSKFNQM